MVSIIDMINLLFYPLYFWGINLYNQCIPLFKEVIEMKIERISENQIKFTLTKDDLVTRNIKLEELIKPSEKTQKLFLDMMRTALDEYGFKGDAPLMIEAVPVAMDGIMIIVTKITENVDDIIPKILNNEDTKPKAETKKPKSAPPKPKDSEEKDFLKMRRKDLMPIYSVEMDKDDCLIYSFENLDDILDLFEPLAEIYSGNVSVYKHRGIYNLILNAADIMPNKLNSAEALLDEYGEESESSSVNRAYLEEYGEKIIKDKLIASLSKVF